MKLNLTAQLVLTGFLLAGLSACGSGSTDNAQAAVQSDTANFIDKNKNGVKDADEVFDANHNDVDDAAECLGGDDDHNGRIEGAEKHHNDSDHDGTDDDYKGVKGQCKSVGDDNKNDDNDNDSNDNDDKKRK